MGKGRSEGVREVEVMVMVVGMTKLFFWVVFLVLDGLGKA